MDLKVDWKEIRTRFNKNFRTNFHVSIASVVAQNNPTVTPIGSLFLNKDTSGFYFEKYPSKLPKHAENNRNICVLSVNSGAFFWMVSLLKMKFKSSPGIKLYGTLGARRKATENEINKLKRRVRMTNWLKGNKNLWSDMDTVREISFERCETIHLGEMTK